MNKFNKIMKDNSKFQIWENLDNGCHIATMGYSKENVLILYKLLKSFEEQYGEVIDYKSAEEELKLYENKGKLFLYLDSDYNVVSMNGCIFNYDNDTVDFISEGDTTNLYFYGLSTVKEFRGKGACTTLVNYAIDFAKENGFDVVYARTDLVGSNSERLMGKSGLEVCTYDDYIIAEWVDVTEEKGDYRLHMWMPLHDKVSILPKGDCYYASNDNDRIIIDDQNKCLKKTG